MFLIYLNIFFSLSRSIAAEHISYLFNIFLNTKEYWCDATCLLKNSSA